MQKQSKEWKARHQVDKGKKTLESVVPLNAHEECRVHGLKKLVVVKKYGHKD